MKRILAAFITVMVLVIAQLLLSSGSGDTVTSAPAFIMTAIAGAVCFGGKTKDVFMPILWVAGFYALSFAVIPMLVYSEELQEFSNNDLVSAQWALLAYFVALLIGYALGRGPKPKEITQSHASIPAIAQHKNQDMMVLGMVMLALGLAAYCIIILKSGGLSHFLNWKGSRANIFAAAGGGLVYRLSFLMLSGVAVISTAAVDFKPKLVAMITVAVAFSYLLFLGRNMTVATVAIFLLLYHYKVKQIKTKYVFGGIAALLLLLSVTAVIRAAGEKRAAILADPISFLKEMSQQSHEHVTHTALNYFEFLDTFTRVNEHVKESNELFWGRTFLVQLEPIDNFFFGNTLIESVHPGHFVAVLRRPDLANLAHGEYPSLPGELVLNFGPIGTTPAMLLYGVAIGLLSRLPRRGTGTLRSFALHPYSFIVLVMMVLLGSSMLFNLIVYWLSIGSFSVLWSRRSFVIPWHGTQLA
jgi:hypothetical protein